MGRRPCCSKEEVIRGAWSLQEDRVLTSYIETHGEGKWRDLPNRAGLKRCGKSCRLRWLNYLRPDIKRGNISPEEEDLIIRLHKLLGNRWSLIAGRLPRRTDNEIKNYWNTYLRKRTTGLRKRTTGQSSKTIIQEHTKNRSKERKPSTETSDVEPLKDIEPHQVIRTKAVRCTKVFLPSQQGDPIKERDIEPENYELPPLLTPHEDDCLDFLMDFDIGGIFVPDILYSDYMQAFGGEVQEKSNGTGGDDIGNNLPSDIDGHFSFCETTLLDDWGKSNSIQDGVGLELERLGFL